MFTRFQTQLGRRSSSFARLNTELPEPNSQAGTLVFIHKSAEACHSGRDDELQRRARPTEWLSSSPRRRDSVVYKGESRDLGAMNYILDQRVTDMHEPIYTISARGKPEDKPVIEFLKENFDGISLEHIDSLFGFVERCTLYGGRVFVGRELSEADVQAMYDHSIGVRIPLSNNFATKDEYKQHHGLLEKYHRAGNSIILTNNTLASWIRRDYPIYHLEASVIKNIDTYEKINRSLDIFDTVVLPMRLSLEYDFLDKLTQKQRITLFANAGCAFNCPAKICYHSISKMHKSDDAEFKCSKTTLPRVELGMQDFDIGKLFALGFERFKLLRPIPGGIRGY